MRPVITQLFKVSKEKEYIIETLQVLGYKDKHKEDFLPMVNQIYKEVYQMTTCKEERINIATDIKLIDEINERITTAKNRVMNAFLNIYNIGDIFTVGSVDYIINNITVEILPDDKGEHDIVYILNATVNESHDDCSPNVDLVCHIKESGTLDLSKIEVNYI